MTARCACILWRGTVTLLALSTILLATSNAQPSVNQRRMAIDPTPILVIADDGTEERQFSRIVTRRLDNGTIVVGELGTFELRLFDSQGRYIRKLAARGKGPGEISGSFTMVTSNDTIFVFGIAPFSPANVQWFTAEGYVGSLPQLTDNGFTIQVLDRFQGGRFLVTRGTAGRVMSSSPALGTLVADSTSFGIREPSREAKGVDWLAPVITQWLIGHPWPRGRLATTLSPYVNRPAVTAVASSDRLWIVNLETGEISLRDTDRRELKTIRLPFQTLPFDQKQLELRRQRALKAAGRPLDSARADAMADPAPLPARLPVLASAIAGVDGEVWLTRFSVDETVPHQILLLDRNGAVVAVLSYPAGLEIQQIGRDFVTAVGRDDDGLLRVVVHRLRR